MIVIMGIDASVITHTLKGERHYGLRFGHGCSSKRNVIMVAT